VGIYDYLHQLNERIKTIKSENAKAEAQVRQRRE
jgi:hypothetical protein